jgi:hypothetical protein
VKSVRQTHADWCDPQTVRVDETAMTDCVSAEVTCCVSENVSAGGGHDEGVPVDAFAIPAGDAGAHCTTTAILISGLTGVVDSTVFALSSALSAPSFATSPRSSAPSFAPSERPLVPPLAPSLAMSELYLVVWEARKSLLSGQHSARKAPDRKG